MSRVVTGIWTFSSIAESSKPTCEPIDSLQIVHVVLPTVAWVAPRIELLIHGYCDLRYPTVGSGEIRWP